jgi:hypothetical protein
LSFIIPKVKYVADPVRGYSVHVSNLLQGPAGPLKNLGQTIDGPRSFVIVELENLLQSQADVRQVSFDVRAFLVFPAEPRFAIQVAGQSAAALLESQPQFSKHLRV